MGFNPLCKSKIFFALETLTCINPSVLWTAPLYFAAGHGRGERDKSVALNSFLPFRYFGGVHVSLLPCLMAIARLLDRTGHCEAYIQKEREPKGFSLSGSLSYKLAATYSPTCAVPSAWRGLTSLFGMGRGGSPAL